MPTSVSSLKNTRQHRMTHNSPRVFDFQVHGNQVYGLFFEFLSKIVSLENEVNRIFLHDSTAGFPYAGNNLILDWTGFPLLGSHNLAYDVLYHEPWH